MRKFIVHTRAIPGCCKTSPDVPTIVEVEGEMLTGLEDPSVLWLPKSEFKFRISKPEFLHETHEVKQIDGSKKKVTVPSVYCSHAIYWSVFQARAAAERMIREGLEFEIRKGHIASYTDEELNTKLSEVQEVMLP